MLVFFVSAAECHCFNLVRLDSHQLIRSSSDFYLLDTFSFKSEPTEVQDAAKRPNFEFSQLQSSLLPALNSLRKFKVSKNPCLITMATVQ